MSDQQTQPIATSPGIVGLLHQRVLEREARIAELDARRSETIRQVRVLEGELQVANAQLAELRAERRRYASLSAAARRNRINQAELADRFAALEAERPTHLVHQPQGTEGEAQL